MSTIASLVVGADLGSGTVDAGTAYVTRRGRSLTTAFEYRREYLALPGAYALDPALELFTGQQVASGLPGAFTDCAPDRWGRNLIIKRIRASEGATATPRSIDDIDYLLGVSDLTRQGALRFRLPDSDTWLADDTHVPKLIDLPRLLRASDAVVDDTGALADIKVLLDAGTGTLGGARPKASVLDSDGSLHIAKFPQHSDAWDVMAWEKTALDLADAAGIATPARRFTRIDGRGVLLLARFDRTERARVGYISAMTLLRATDGQDSDYADLAEEITTVSAATSEDLRELWRRAAFSVAIHNTDDHLRNHGLLRDGAGWRLSPMFDVNPNPDIGEARTTGIGGAYARADELDGLLAAAAGFRLTGAQARTVLAEVFAATEDWRAAAARNGIPERQMARFEGSFEGLRPAVAALLAPPSASPHRPASAPR